MRIALVHSFYRSGLPSGENHAVTLQAQALARDGHEVSIVSASSDETMGSQISVLRAGFRVATGFGRNPLKDLERIKPDIIHVHNLFPNWGTSWLKTVGFPLVTTVHNYRSVCASGMLMRDGESCTLCPRKGSQHAVIHSCYRGSRVASVPLAISTSFHKRFDIFEVANKVILLSELSRRTFDSLGVNFHGKSHIIPNFSERPVRSAVHTQPRNSQPWCFVGRISREKGVVELIRRWPSGPRLLVVGDGPLLDFCKSLAAGKKIQFAGHLEHDAVLDTLSKSQGLIFPSLVRENSPLVFSEALSLGIPVVALRGNSVAEKVEDSDFGITMSDWSELQSAMGKITANWLEFSRAALREYESEFSEPVWLRRINSLYASALSR